MEISLENLYVDIGFKRLSGQPGELAAEGGRLIDVF